MHFPESGFDKTLLEIKGKNLERMNKPRESANRGSLTEEESAQVREVFRAAARYLLDGIDGKDRL